MPLKTWFQSLSTRVMTCNEDSFPFPRVHLPSMPSFSGRWPPPVGGWAVWREGPSHGRHIKIRFSNASVYREALVSVSPPPRLSVPLLSFFPWACPVIWCHEDRTEGIFFALVFFLQLVPPSWTLKGTLARRQKTTPSWPFTPTPHGAEGAVEVGRLEGRSAGRGGGEAKARSCRGAGSRRGLWGLKSVSAGRLAIPPKEEGRA